MAFCEKLGLPFFLPSSYLTNRYLLSISTALLISTPISPFLILKWWYGFQTIFPASWLAQPPIQLPLEAALVPLKGWFWKKGPQTSSSTWELVRKANSQGPTQTHRIKHCGAMWFNKPSKWFRWALNSQNHTAQERILNMCMQRKHKMFKTTLFEIAKTREPK